jgi:hypothetical protein
VFEGSICYPAVSEREMNRNKPGGTVDFAGSPPPSIELAGPGW